MQHPLSLPAGSVRAVLAIVVTLSAIFAVLRAIPHAELLTALAAMIIGHYFGQRSKNHSNVP